MRSMFEMSAAELRESMTEYRLRNIQPGDEVAVPAQITTDKEPALSPAIENDFDDTKHRDVKYLNKERTVKLRMHNSMDGGLGALWEMTGVNS